MKELIYYGLFAIILYFVLSQVFDNFYLEQENFDPSLVPVSSIVTLAKVAQKLVNGNGTLTNPGNLQIGKDASAPGNLTVTGTATIGGPIVGNGNYTGLTVNGNLNAKGYGLNVDNMINLGASNVQLGSDGAHGLKVMDENGANGNITGKNLTVTGRLTIPTNTWHKSSDDHNRFWFDPNGPTNYESGNGSHVFRGHADTDGIKISGDNAENLTVPGNITVNSANTSGKGNIVTTGNITAGSITAGGAVTVTGGITTSGDIKMNDKQLLLRGGGDGNHYIKYGVSPLDGPEIRGCRGGSLGTASGCNRGTDKVALQWGNDNNVTINGAFTLPHSIWHQSSDSKNRLFYGNNSHTFFGTNDRYVWRSNTDANMMELDGASNLTVNGNTTVRGSLASTAIRITSTWDDKSFLNGMAPYFSTSEPDGTNRLFMIKHPSLDTYRLQIGIKMGSQIWRYPLWFNGADCSGCYNYPADGNDGWRKSL